VTNPTRQACCPTCNTPIIWDERFPYRPFCSKRCRLIDLGEWLDEERRIPESEPEEGAPFLPPEAENH
jgi:endogenous inhibitor of DNA gyrase (YacG/DUF329 family)